ncbi:MAG: hypothetical protein AAGK05_15060 [Pseudomonadota bacterium]
MCANFSEFTEMMKSMMENLTEMLKASFEKQTDVLHHELFNLKEVLDGEKKKRMKLEEKNNLLREEVRHFTQELHFVMDKLNDVATLCWTTSTLKR